MTKLSSYKYMHSLVFFALLACYLLALGASAGITPVHIGAFFILIVLYSAHRDTRLLLLITLPFIIENSMWDTLRYIPFSYYLPIHVAEPYNWELALFGINSGDKLITLCAWLARLRLRFG